MLRWMDAHCDALTKLYLNPNETFESDGSRLDVNMPRLKQGSVMLQCFAIYLTRSIRRPQFADILDYAKLYRDRVLGCPTIREVRTRRDLRRLAEQAGGEIGAMLTLEGSDALLGDASLLETLYELGVRALSLTWNYANWAADGAMEPRGAGMTMKGRAFVKTCEQLGILIDVSHLSERAFWELCDATTGPVYASHSNAAALCPHPRNLTDRQIHELIARDGRIGINFYPPFLTDRSQATIDDVIRHIDHVCELGGAKHVMIGSDFDGIEQRVNGLEHAGQLQRLAERLERRYSREVAEDIAWKNAYRFYEANLPES